MINLPTRVWVTWSFTLWWLFVAIHDYVRPACPRYRNRRALYLALVAAGQLAWLGYLLLQLEPIAWVVLVAFGLTWLLWRREASEGQKATSFGHFYSKGQKLFEQGHLEKAVEQFRQALSIAKARGNNEQQIRAYEALGGMLFAQGHLGQAVEKWEEALRLAEKHRMQKDIALLYGLLGSANLGRGLLSKAEEELKRSRHLCREEGIGGGEAHALRNLASIYVETGRGKEAIEVLKETEDLYHQHRDELGAVDQKSNQGRVYRLLCDYPQLVGCDSRAEALKRARDLHEEAYKYYNDWLQLHEGHRAHYPSVKVPLEIRGYRNRAANQLGSIADTYRIMGDWEKAKVKYEQQIEEGLGIVFLEDLSGLALCYMEVGENSKALATIERAFEVNKRDRQLQDPRTEYLLYFRRGYLYEKTGQMDKACRDYEKAMVLTQSERTAAAGQLISLLVNRSCGDDKAWCKAFTVLERSRSQAFLEELSRLSLGRQRDLGPVRYGDVQELVDSFGIAAALVEFYTLPDKFIAFVLQSGEKEPAVAQVPMSQDQLLRHVQNYWREVVEYSGRGDIGQRWQELAGPLLADVLPLLDRAELVYLVPHSLLHYLPLHALRVDGEYLIDRFPIAYAPSAAVLGRVIQRTAGIERAANGRKALVLGYTPHEHERAVFEGEAVQVAKFFGTEAHVGKNATGALLREKGAQYDTLHLSCHGFFHPTDPLASGLLLADGVLTARDIMGLRLNADLVTLSACQTALSDQQPGDELVGLTRALLYAGASSVLVTLWSVDAVAALELMGDFYGRLRGKDGAKVTAEAVALREAMLEMRKEREHPYYWAPFISVGDWR
jgi:CHAT domain-containing protein